MPRENDGSGLDGYLIIKTRPWRLGRHFSKCQCKKLVIMFGSKACKWPNKSKVVVVENRFSGQEAWPKCNKLTMHLQNEPNNSFQMGQL